MTAWVILHHGIFGNNDSSFCNSLTICQEIFTWWEGELTLNPHFFLFSIPLLFSLTCPICHNVDLNFATECLISFSPYFFLTV